MPSQNCFLHTSLHKRVKKNINNLYILRAIPLKKLVTFFPMLFLLLVLYIILHKTYMPRINSFGCFDDCFNFTAGYFITKGKILYSQIFFNHQPLMAYISYFIQSIFHPINIYELLLRHRQFVLLFGFMWNILIVLRYSYAGFGFVIFYEFTKFYLFGDRFLAEGLIVYPLVYMLGLVWNRFNKIKIYYAEYILAAVSTWFVLFMREPFIPVALILYFLILFGKDKYKIKIISLVIFFVLVIFILLNIPLKDYIFNVITINSGTFINSATINKNQIFNTFFYPVSIFFNGDWNIFRYYLIGLDIVFICLLILMSIRKKSIKFAILLFFILGFANFRSTVPGKIFYEAFHMLPWYAMFTIITFLMIRSIYQIKKSLAYVFSFFMISLFIYILTSPSFFIYDKIIPHESFMINYSNYLQAGEVIKNLSRPSDTLFIDGFDELIQWQADRPSPYKYSMYTSLMPLIPKYSNERNKMFINNLPDFYYGSCFTNKNPLLQMPESIKKQYIQLYSGNIPTCLYIKKTKIPEISPYKWKKAKELLYELSMQ